MASRDESYSVAGRDTGGRTYTEAELRYFDPRWCMGEQERGALAKAECVLELALDDVKMAAADFEETERRPGWAKEARRLAARIDKLRAAVHEELEL